MSKERNWTVEDNIVALYLARFGDKGLILREKKIKDLIENTGKPKKGFPLRVQNYRYIITKGKKGLSAGYEDGFPKYKNLFLLFLPMSRDWFREYVNLILETRIGLKER